MRDDKQYHVTDTDRIEMMRLFVKDIGDDRIVLDTHFLDEWNAEMTTQDVDQYVREAYSEDIVHVFGTDTIASMPFWDSE